MPARATTWGRPYNISVNPVILSRKVLPSRLSWDILTGSDVFLIFELDMGIRKGLTLETLETPPLIPFIAPIGEFLILHFFIFSVD